MSALAGISALIVLASARPVPAALPVRVVWDAPAGCSDAESFYAAVLSRAERARRAEPGEAGIPIEVKLARMGAKVHGELRLATGDGRNDLRKVDGATCDEVAEALSLTAALALSRSAPGPTPEPGSPAASSLATERGAGTVAPVTPAPSPAVAMSSEAPAAAPSPALPAPPSPPVPPAAPSEPPRQAPAPPQAVAAPAQTERAASLWSWFAGGVGLAAGEVVAPHFSLGGTAFLRVQQPEEDRVVPSAALGFVYLRNGLFGGGSGAAFSLAAAALTACPGLGWRGAVVSVELCAVGLGERLSASDTAVTVSRPVTRSWWSAGAAAQVRAPVGQGFALQLDASASIPLVERRFVTTTPDQTVGTSPRVAPIFTLSLFHRL